MKRKADDLSFEGAWGKSVEKEEVARAEPKKEVKVHDKPAFRGQRNIIENRKSIILPSKKTETAEKQEVAVVDKPSSKEGDDFDVQW